MRQNHPSYPQVALDFMNRDHEEFAALRGKLLDLIDSGTADAIDGLLDELQRHTVRHFADEEKAMQEAGFPVYAVHKGEHDAVLVDMAARIEGWRRERDIAVLRDWLDAAVGEWFVSHVSSMDTVTAGFIAAQRQRS
ncbi:MAG: hemerythrin [Rhodocyclaceae bacterium]|nr:MAG: hemerythrin [Rhodocyclaceae bacterium]TND00567.1 MAG: hemerythrin [Rhodocyclaceae bacterium]